MPGPVTLSESRRARFITLCALYFAQGVPWGFVTIALIALLSERGATAEQTGVLVTVSVLPWTFKIIWGPIIDSFQLPSLGRRRPWIVLAQLMMAATLLVSVSTADLASEVTIFWLGVIFFTHNCFASLQDVATDGMAVDLLKDSERGRVNGFMWASKLLGISIGGAGMATVMKLWGMETGMRLQALGILLIMLLPLLIRERPGDKLFPWSRRDDDPSTPLPVHVSTGPRKVARNLMRAFSMRAPMFGIIVASLAYLAEGLVTPINAELFTQQLGWTAEKFGHVHGIWGTVGKLVGAIGGGLICDRIGHRKVAAAGFIFTALTFALFAATSRWWHHESYPLVLLFLCFELGMATMAVSLFAMYMHISWTAAAATQFTLFMTMCNVGFAVGPYLTRLGLDYRSTYFLAAGLSLVPIIFLPFVDTRRMARRRLADVRRLGMSLNTPAG